MNRIFDIIAPVITVIAVLYVSFSICKSLCSERNKGQWYGFFPYSKRIHRNSGLFLLIPLLALASFTAPEMSVFAEGTSDYCGDPAENDGKNLIWSFDDAAGTLTISGEGKMQESNYPWSDLSSAIENVVLSQGVTSIGPRAFAGFTGLSSINIPSSITHIGASAFENSGLRTITVELENRGTPLVLGENTFTGTNTYEASIKVPGYHNVTFSVNPDNTGFSIGEFLFGNSEPDPGSALLRWTDRTVQTELTATGGIPNTYQVIFEKNAADATGTMYPQTFTYDKAQSLDENQYIRPGYSFTGWAVEAKGNVVYADKSEVKNLTENQDGIVLLYAKWKKTGSTSGMNFFRLRNDCILPSTGFSSLRPTTLSSQPMNLSYKPTGLRMMIPSLNVDMELVFIPRDNNSWAVEWLGDRGGILEGSALPGDGYSFVAAHNTLNDTEYGPFAMLGALEVNDLITINGNDRNNKTLKTFRVFENTILTPDDMKTLEKIAGSEENTLVLVTCENESAEGGYLNRRVIFAKPGK